MKAWLLLATLAAVVTVWSPGARPAAGQPANGFIEMQVSDADGAAVTFCLYTLGVDPIGVSGTGYITVSTGDRVEIAPGIWSVLFVDPDHPFCDDVTADYAESWLGDATAQAFGTPLTVEAGTVSILRAALAPPALVTGGLTITDAPVPEVCERDVEVAARRVEPRAQFSGPESLAGNFALHLDTLVNGRFELTLPAGRYELGIRCGGRNFTPTPDRAGIVVAAGERVDIELPVARSTPLRIDLVDLRTARPVLHDQACVDVLTEAGDLYETLTTSWLAIPFGGRTSLGWLTDVAPGRYLIRFRNCGGELDLQPQYFGPSITGIAASPVTVGAEPVVVPFGVAERGLRCKGRLPTIAGGPGDDELVGTDGDDVIMGRGGNDTIIGGGGHDLICAGPGDDYVDGGVGHDRIYGQGGIDELHGGNGIDRISGGPGDDSLYGERSVDKLMGGAGADLLEGGDKRDIADYRLAPGGVFVHLGQGVGSFGEAFLDTYVSIEKVAGSRHDDMIIGDENNNVLFGWAGNDVLDGLGGNDLCRFGEVVSNCERD
ncbi:MAG: hypothetical protein HKN26_04850 [Acidimicrobiales bacterium]|nr:hypothetical protein [Acidimicrobiales bacterium]